MNRKFLFVCTLAAGSLSLHADEEATKYVTFPEKVAPWFTGPLISTSGYTTPAGHVNVEPYLYYTVYPGRYDNHWKARSLPNFYSTTLQVQIAVGVAKNISFQIYPQAFHNETEGRHDTNVGDLPIALNFQLYRPPEGSLWPSAKLALRASVPFGKYQHLNPHLKKTDANGAGSWFPGVGLTFAKIWNTSGIHFLESRLSLNYLIGTAVHVKGINTYGGARNTRGFVYPGNIFTADYSVQYNFTQRWAFACDLFYAHTNKNRFSGRVGSSHGVPAQMRAPSNEQWSLAPAIEYNWSQNLGIIVGPWFSFAGRNSAEFISGVAALNAFF
ncbi:MAG: hypothetical protein HYX48_00875 [Chlamydiales bacterium]|nr:hypothetical protein [Chlamydiales bacterium]